MAERGDTTAGPSGLTDAEEQAVRAELRKSLRLNEQVRKSLGKWLQRDKAKAFAAWRAAVQHGDEDAGVQPLGQLATGLVPESAPKPVGQGVSKELLAPNKPKKSMKAAADQVREGGEWVVGHTRLASYLVPQIYQTSHATGI